MRHCTVLAVVRRYISERPIDIIFGHQVKFSFGCGEDDFC
jgi:hypothetical protein